MIFLRHAQQKFDPNLKKYQDNGLTSEGIIQANQVAKALAHKYGDALRGGIIYSSPLNRAQETYRLVQKNLDGNWIHHVDDRLIERRYHENESTESLLKRADSFYRDILYIKDKPLIVICHGEWYKALAAFHHFNLLRLGHAEYIDLNEIGCQLKSKL